MSADTVTGTDLVRSAHNPQDSDSGVFAWGVLLLELPQTFPWWEEGVLSDFEGSRQSALSYQCKPRGARLTGLSSHLRAINRQSFFLHMILHPVKLVLAYFISRLHSKPWEAESCVHSLHGACRCPPPARRFISHIPVTG